MKTLELIPLSGQYDAAVCAVHDGDTITAGLLAGVPVRLNGINAPELNTDAGKAAQKALALLLGSQTITLTLHGREKYGRLLCDLTLPDGTDVSQWMIARGYAAPWDGHGPKPVPQPQPQPQPKETMNALCKPRIRFPHAAGTSYYTADLCRLYNWPINVTGPDSPIGIISLGGGHKPSDAAMALAAQGLPAPHITDVSIDGATNAFGNDADTENALDIQVSAASRSYSTRQPANIRFYSALNTDASFINALKRACAECGTVSISWGAMEKDWGKPACQAFDAAAADGVNQGTNIVTASGDNDSGDGGAGANTDFPASSPHVIGCGGTSKPKSGPESVWNDGQNGTGGGYSTYFPVPTYQVGIPANAPGRMVPDWAANADPQTGYKVVVDGQWTVVGGTSASTPMTAGLISTIATAAAAAGRPKLGDIHAFIYQHPADFADITVGDNGQYRARTGLDECTGLGVPNGTALLSAVLATIGPPPEKPVTQILTGTVKIPFLGNAAMTGVITPAPSGNAAAEVTPELTLPPVLQQILDTYGPAVMKVIVADLPAVLWFKTKTWADVLKDVMAAVGLAA